MHWKNKNLSGISYKIKKPLHPTMQRANSRGTTSGSKVLHRTFLTECHHTRTLYWAFPAHLTDLCVQAAAPGCIQLKTSAVSHLPAAL